MKNATMLLLFVFMLACSANKELVSNEVLNISDEEKKKGLSLVSESDCFVCHKIDENLVGPSYAQIAEKYEGTTKTLTELSKKIINGGNGNWGKVYMTPHAGMPERDAAFMIKYILSLKK